ncbi:hypothetical protein [Ketogulonicigenium vulgare]|uniref:hypothetical protein n=1 Tax=Ketogulonicigenium vulgare TaxID=92945 RepID=UPI0023587C5D|nr:hypothetical protein [Ketogulonicigenium vulgare]
MRKHIPTFIAGTAATVVGGLILSAVSQQIPALSFEMVQDVLAWPWTPLIFSGALGVLIGYGAERFGAWVSGRLPPTREERAMSLAIRLRDLAEDCDYARDSSQRVLPVELDTRILLALDDLHRLKLLPLENGHSRLPHQTRIDLFATYFLALCPALEAGKFSIADKVTVDTNRIIIQALNRLKTV